MSFNSFKDIGRINGNYLPTRFPMNSRDRPRVDDSDTKTPDLTPADLAILNSLLPSLRGYTTRRKLKETQLALLRPLFNNDAISRFVDKDKDNLGRFIHLVETSEDSLLFSGAWNQEFLDSVRDFNPPLDDAINALGQSVAHISIEDNTAFGTGTMISDQYMITAGHVPCNSDGSARDPSELTVYFGYDIPRGDAEGAEYCNGGSDGERLKRYCRRYSEYDVDRNSYCVTEIKENGTAAGIDYAILQIEERFSTEHPSARFPVLSTKIPEVFSSATPKNMSLVSVIHHPMDRPKKISLGAVKECLGDAKVFKHSAHTEAGSSGSPIVIPSSGASIVAIHTGASEEGTYPLYNTALTVSAISEKSPIVRSLLPKR